MALETTGNLALFREQLGEDKVGVSLPPKLSGSAWPDMTDTGANVGFGVTSWSENPEEAWKYISFVAQQENQELFWNEQNDIPVNRNGGDAVRLGARAVDARDHEAPGQPLDLHGLPGVRPDPAREGRAGVHRRRSVE